MTKVLTTRGKDSDRISLSPSVASMGSCAVRSGHSRILCVDTDDLTRILFRETFEQAGFRVETAGDGDEALACLKVCPREFDVIVTDHTLPYLDGLDLVAELRQREFGGFLVVATRGPEQAIPSAYRTWGVDAVLQKPLDPQRLGVALCGRFRRCGSRV